MILLLAALLAALPPLPPHAPPAAAKAERKLLESRARELKKKKEWPLAAGTAVVVRAEGKKGEPALVIVRGKAIHATVSCAVIEQGPEAGAENAVAERGAMTLTSAQGEVTVASAGAPAAPAAEGAALHEGEVLATGVRSRAEILLATGSILRLGPSSRVELHAEEGASSFRARLSFG